MVSEQQLRTWVEHATDADVQLWYALVRLADALDDVSETQRDATLDAVWRLTQDDTDWSVWRAAIRDWD